MTYTATATIADDTTVNVCLDVDNMLDALYSADDQFGATVWTEIGPGYAKGRFTDNGVHRQVLVTAA